MYTQACSSPPPADPSAWGVVSALASAVDANLDRWLIDHHHVGLTEWRSLGLLSASPDKELRVNDLARQVGLGQSSVTRLISRLETKGLARRDVCEADGRGVYAVITTAGEDVVRSVREPYLDHVRTLLGATMAGLGLDAAELRRALRAVEELVSG